MKTYYPCTFTHCKKECTSPSGLTRHQETCTFNPVNLRVPSPLPDHPPFEDAGGWDAGIVDVDAATVEMSGAPCQWKAHAASGTYIRKHPYLDGQRCDEQGYDVENNAPPPLTPTNEDNEEPPFYPFDCVEEFEIADLLFKQIQMSASNITALMDVWGRYNARRNQDRQCACDSDSDSAPYNNSKDLYATIDAIPLGDVPWEAFTVEYEGEKPDNAPSWMSQSYEVWFRDPLEIMESQFRNPDIAKEIDFAPKQVRGMNGQRVYCDFMSGNWAWDQATKIAHDPQTHGAVFAPVILGSDKTTVSVATGQNEYYPLYASLGNVQNHVRRAHRDAVAVIGFLSIPKTHKQYAKSAAFRKFRRQLFHSSLRHILQRLKPWMEKPKLTQCGDGYYYRVIYGLGPYIADYPEQCLLACVVSGWCPRCTALPTDLDNQDTSCHRSQEHTSQLYDASDGNVTELWDGYGIIADILPFTTDFPRGDIYELLAPDILHQIIKGTFKDHLVDWITKYIYETAASTREADRIMDEIDKRIDVVPPFPGLRHFHQGRDFKQWTGDDSKALMKVFLPAIAGLVPDQMVRAVSAFLDFCYLVRRSVIDEETLIEIDEAVERFHREREIFIDTKVRDSVSLPRQHSVVHYRWLIQQFGAPNGLCSSITESKHIKSVKEPWRRSNRHEPLGQMLLTNQRVDKLNALRAKLDSLGLLCKSTTGPHAEATGPDSELPTQDIPELVDRVNEVALADDGVRSDGDVRLSQRPASKYPRNLEGLSLFLEMPHLIESIRRFLYDQLNPGSNTIGMEADLVDCPLVHPHTTVKVYHSAESLFYAPSDLSGIGGMSRQTIHARPSWRRGGGRHDCVLVAKSDAEGFLGLNAAQVHIFLSFEHNGADYKCALVHWFEQFGETPCPNTGMWRVEPHCDEHNRRLTSVIHIDSILRNTHLIPVFGSDFTPSAMTSAHVLHAYNLYFINKFADHHSHTVAF